MKIVKLGLLNLKTGIFVDEIMDGEVINSSIGMEFEDLNDYLHDAGYNIVL